VHRSPRGGEGCAFTARSSSAIPRPSCSTSSPTNATTTTRPSTTLCAADRRTDRDGHPLPLHLDSWPPNGRHDRRDHRLRPTPPAAYHHPPRRDGHHQRPAVRTRRGEHPPAVGLRPPTPRAAAAAHPRDRRRWPPTDRRHLEAPPDHPPTPSGFATAPKQPPDRSPDLTSSMVDHHPRGATRRAARRIRTRSPKVRTPADRLGCRREVCRQTRRGQGAAPDNRDCHAVGTSVDWHDAGEWCGVGVTPAVIGRGALAKNRPRPRASRRHDEAGPGDFIRSLTASPVAVLSKSVRRGGLTAPGRPAG
jgi:hypothetical protein